MVSDWSEATGSAASDLLLNGGSRLPSAGIVLPGKVDAGFEGFNVPRGPDTRRGGELIDAAMAVAGGEIGDQTTLDEHEIRQAPSRIRRLPSGPRNKITPRNS